MRQMELLIQALQEGEQNGFTTPLVVVMIVFGLRLEIFGLDYLRQHVLELRLFKYLDFQLVERGLEQI